MRHMKTETKIKQYDKRRMMIVVMLIVIAFFCIFLIVGKKKEMEIIIKVDAMTMLQEEQLPTFTAKILSTEKPEVVLDKKKNYTVGKLISDLKKEGSYVIKPNTDGTTDGTYKIHAVINKKFYQMQQKKWKRYVKFHVEDGILTVENKYGVWEGTKFLKADGVYITNDWLSSQGNRYYFDENSNKVIGKRQIGIYNCKFGKNGKLLSQKIVIDSKKPMIALTFDDGPGEGTHQILSELERWGAHATFFMIGKNIAKYDDTVKYMEAIGCEMGNHTFSHKKLTKLDAQSVAEEIQGMDNQLREAVEKKTTVMRPPWGAVNDIVRTTAEVPLIMWSIDTKDWKTRNTQGTIDNVLNTAVDGDIVLMHDIHITTVDAAITIIPELINRGYQLVTVSELAKARGISLENGSIYYEFHPN